jgi:hypothetical protein
MVEKEIVEQYRADGFIIVSGVFRRTKPPRSMLKRIASLR